MRIQSVIITRFCYRSGEPGTMGQRWFDPLERGNVEHRLRLLEIAPLPSLIAQTDQDFEWVLVIDRLLDADLRARLVELVGRRGRTHLYVFDQADDLRAPGWLERYHPPLDDGDYLVTSHLDDDDALPRDFVEELKRATARMARAGTPLGILGATEISNWDLLLNAATPRGTTAPWHRNDPWNARVASCGFSLATRQPDYPFTVMGKSHVQARDYVDFDRPARKQGVESIRQQFLTTAAAAGDDLRRFTTTDTFRDLSEDVGPVIMTNHRQNLQRTRLFESKPGQRPVVGPETFPTTEIDWEALDRSAAHFEMTPRLRIERLRWQARQTARRLRRRVRWRRGVRALVNWTRRRR